MYQNKTVVVTGGSQGIGAVIAQGYQRLGAQVIVLDIAANTNPNVDYVPTDLAEAEQVMAAFDYIATQYGAVHVLINNGGITSFHKPLADLSYEEFTRVVNVNLNGAFACSKAFLEANKGESYGRIVNIASTRWNQNEAGWDAYGASKGGIVAMTQSMCVSLSGSPVTVNAISPGWIETGDYTALAQEDHLQHPSRRVGKARDILNACLFLTHPDNDFVNGTNLVVDGGMSKKMIYQDSLLD